MAVFDGQIARSEIVWTKFESLWVLKNTEEVSGLDVDDEGNVYVTGESFYKNNECASVFC